tara:strand:+ start:17155 stop:17676 length:522 start_codon:yes stop_codon:yes gene_type:complete
MTSYKEISKDLQEKIKRIKCVIFDFDGVFTNNKVYLDQNGIESVRCDRSDGMGIKILKSLGIDVLILSSEINSVVSMRAKKLKIECFYGVEDKLSQLNNILDTKTVRTDQVLYVGNDINDADCLKAVGFPIVVRDSHPDVIDLGIYVTNSKGGNGAVREVSDLIEYYQNDTTP